MSSPVFPTPKWASVGEISTKIQIIPNKQKKLLEKINFLKKLQSITSCCMMQTIIVLRCARCFSTCHFLSHIRQFLSGIAYHYNTHKKVTIQNVIFIDTIHHTRFYDLSFLGVESMMLSTMLIEVIYLKCL